MAIGVAAAQGKKGWQQAGELVTGQRDQVVTMQANFPEPDTYTCQFSIVTPPPVLATPPGFPQFDAQAEVRWSVEGQSVSRLISIGNGTSITGVGQAVRVRMVDVLSSTLSAFFNHPYVVSVQCSRGQRPAQEKPPTLKGLAAGITTIVPGASLVIPIPPQAGVISAYLFVDAFPTANRPIQVRAVQRTGVVSIGFWDPLVTQGWIPILPNASLIEVFNDAAVGDVVVSLTWGIDG
jgi:hypothetical protein